MINLVGYTNFSTGYGISTLNILSALSELEQVALFPIGNIDSNSIPIDKHELVKRGLDVAKQYTLSSPSVRVAHANDLSLFPGTGMRIGFPIFELDRFTVDEVHQLNALDQIFVCSEWAKNVVIDKANGFGKVNVIPLGVDRSIFHENVQHGFRDESRTIFFNIGKYERRKGQDFLIEAFNNAFSPLDNVGLMLVCNNPFLSVYENTLWRSWAQTSRMGSSVIFSDRLTSQQQLAIVIASGDCGVFPSRAEGWNLELLECLAMAKHVIATNYSGHTEFINQDNARLIEVNSLESAVDNMWFDGHGQWAKLGPDQLEQTVEHMREVHRLKQCGQLASNVAGVATSKIFSWQNTARKILEGLN
jgi:glycosyltransferase involved in cell wall biosynthesis